MIDFNMYGLFSPPGYYAAPNFDTLWNQWLHYGYVRKMWSFEFYEDNQRIGP